MAASRLSSLHVVERMAPQHLDEVLAIERVSYPNPWTLDSFRHEIEENPFSRPTIARTAGTTSVVSGYCVFWVVFEHARVQNLAVHPEERRSGVGRLLLEHAVERSRGEGAQTLDLEVRPSNRPARELYTSFGFRVVGEVAGYYSNPGEPALRLQYDFEASG